MFWISQNSAPHTEDVVLYAFCKSYEHGVIQLVKRRVIHNQPAPFYSTNVRLQQKQIDPKHLMTLWKPTKQVHSKIVTVTIATTCSLSLLSNADQYPLLLPNTDKNFMPGDIWFSFTCKLHTFPLTPFKIYYHAKAWTLYDEWRDKICRKLTPNRHTSALHL